MRQAGGLGLAFETWETTNLDRPFLCFPTSRGFKNSTRKRLHHRLRMPSNYGQIGARGGRGFSPAI